MKKNIFLLSVSLVCLFTAVFIGCSGFSLDVTIPRQVVEEQVLSKFPITRSRGLGMLEVTIHNAELDFKTKPDRLTVKAQTTANFLGIAPVQGEAVVDGRVEYNPETGSFYFTDIALQRYRVNDLSQDQLDEVSGFIGSIVASVFGGLKLYTLDPNKTSENLAKLALQNVRTNSKGIVATLGLRRE